MFDFEFERLFGILLHMETKQCTKCAEEKELSNFNKSAMHKGGYHPWCRECKTTYYRERRRNKPTDADVQRAHNIKSLYGITAEEYDALLEKQGGQCAICPAKASESTRKFSVDHDHSCCPGRKSCGRCVRGIICIRCNTALGMVNDEIETLKKMLTYIEKFAS